jgi:hypothetical protein
MRYETPRLEPLGKVFEITEVEGKGVLRPTKALLALPAKWRDPILRLLERLQPQRAGAAPVQEARRPAPEDEAKR